MRWRVALIAAALAGAALACDRGQEAVIVITATFLPPTTVPGDVTLPSVTQAPLSTEPPASSPGPVFIPTITLTYVVQAGDTLTAIALANTTTVETLLRLNALANADQLFEGQTLALPGRPAQRGPDMPILPDALLVRGPESREFDAVAFAEGQPGRLRDLRERVDGVEMTGPQIVERISTESSVDARALLAMLEYRSRLLTTTETALEAELYPVFTPTSPSDIGRTGLYRQLAWTADRMNAGYYGRKYRGLEVLETTDGARFLLAENLEPGTAALQHVFSKMLPETEWLNAVSPQGYLAAYTALFGDSRARTWEEPAPESLIQPPLALPFVDEETWYFTGGPHGGWGAGSAWAAVDFAPPDDPALVEGPCYVSGYFVTAVADGVIARSGSGVVMLDLDGDGDETTGWTVMYLHVDDRDRVASGARVRTGDRIGRPSCAGGVSNGTHVHVARRYNGEWLPASCMECSGTHAPPSPFVLGGWQVVDLPGQEYQGYLVQGEELRVAEAARGVAPNEITAPAVVN